MPSDGKYKWEKYISQGNTQSNLIPKNLLECEIAKNSRFPLNTSTKIKAGISHFATNNKSTTNNNNTTNLAMMSTVEKENSNIRIYEQRASRYKLGKTLGNGSFGLVKAAQDCKTGSKVAIKKVYQDPLYKNRELEVMRELHHPNIVQLQDYYYCEEPLTEASSPQFADCKKDDDTVLDKKGDKSSNTPPKGLYLNLVMEHIPETVYRVIRGFVRHGCNVPIRLVKLYAFQMCRSLGYLHARGVCHRDIKPQNLLVDPNSHILKLCDFGSAKRLTKGDRSVAYICSRFYRAPELMLGCTDYCTAIDIWSLGCVFAELLMGRPLFAGENSVDQLVRIIQVLGTPTRDQMAAMNKTYTEFKFPEVKPREWRKLFHSHVGDDAIDLLAMFLCYEPEKRIKPLDALGHEFFEELFDRNARSSDNLPMPQLLPLTQIENEHISESAFKKLETYQRMVGG